MKLSEITATLRDIGVSPIKSLGQNFLHDRNLAQWIIDRAEIDRKDFVVEIGPGLGALTELALAKGARVLAIEKDKRLADYLRANFSSARLEVIHGDALEFDVRTLYAHARVKLLGNLPYYVSSQLLLKFLEYPSPISLWLLMLQKELAQRLGAAPRTSDYGALTLLVQLHHRVEYLRTVKANVFLPKPEIDSALVRITPRDPHELAPLNFAVFENLVRSGFSQRRKQVGKLIRENVPDWERASAELRLNPKARAEELSLQQWIALSNYARPHTFTERSDASQELFAVVDEADRPIGAAPREEVHANNLLHRAIHILIFNSAGEVFLQFRSRSKDRNPLRWDSSAAGHVSAGEDYDETAKRELFEELSVQIPLEKLAKLPASRRTDYEFVCLYRGRCDAGFRLNSDEIEGGGFFPPALVDAWIKARPHKFAPTFLECWRVWGKKSV